VILYQVINVSMGLGDYLVTCSPKCVWFRSQTEFP